MLTIKNILEHEVSLKRLELQYFRGFSFLDIDFGATKPITVFIADNGGGKSSVLDIVAEFLHYFLHVAILSNGKDYRSSLNAKSIMNGKAASRCKVNLVLQYPYPAVELFEVCQMITDYMNDFELKGEKAVLAVSEHQDWQISIDGNEGIAIPQEVEKILEQLSKGEKRDMSAQPKLSSEDEIEVAVKVDGQWKANLDLGASRITKAAYTGELRMICELNRGSEPKFTFENQRPDSIEGLIDALNRGTAFIEDFKNSVIGYKEYDGRTVLPILAYYGSAAIDAKFGTISTRYVTQPFQAYHNALVPSRFDFEDFLAWFNALEYGPPHIHIKEQVVKAITNVLNADQNVYSNLRMESGELVLDKHFPNAGSLLIEVGQLSAGEKNLLALVGDLIKRAIQLNPILFNLDYDQEQETYAQLAEHTRGLVLIDEIGLHLHPKWQRKVVPALAKIFPQLVFFITTHSPFILQSLERPHILSLPDLKVWRGLSGWEIYEIVQNAMADSGDTLSDKYQNEMKRFNDAILYDNMKQMEESYLWLNQHLHPDNPKRPALEMQFNVFFRKNEYE